jgi:hypothetical protein
MRYFATERDGRPHSLFRFEVSDAGIVEQRWTPTGWIESSVPSEYLVEGSHDLWELSYETARKFYPI